MKKNLIRIAVLVGVVALPFLADDYAMELVNDKYSRVEMSDAERMARREKTSSVKKKILLPLG